MFIVSNIFYYVPMLHSWRDHSSTDHSAQGTWACVYSLGGRFSTQMLSRRMKPSAHSQRNDPSSLMQASLSPGHVMALSEHSSMSEKARETLVKHHLTGIKCSRANVRFIEVVSPRHFAPVSLNPRAHFLQRAGPLPIQPTHAWSQPAHSYMSTHSNTQLAFASISVRLTSALIRAVGVEAVRVGWTVSQFSAAFIHICSKHTHSD